MGKAIDFQETTEAWEVKVDTYMYSQTNEYMMIYDNPRSWPFIDLCPVSLRFNIFKLCFSQKKSTTLFEAKFHLEPPWDVRMKIYSNDPGHMTNMVSRPIHVYGKKV